MFIVSTGSVAQVNTKTLSIASFINKHTVSCNTGNDKQHQSFIDLTTLLSVIQTNVPNINGKPYQINDNWMTGIKSLSVNTQNKDNGIEKTKDISFLVQKYGVTFLNVGAFDFKSRNSELNGNGYYFILKGKPITNLAKLKKQGFNTSNMAMYETSEHNSRLNCFITG